ncbi:MAG: SDR family oxidoreductase, partial [Aestuariivirgaceae bacterium]
MKILVTGRHGQLACALHERAANRDGIDLVCVGRPELDLENPHAIRPILHELKPDVVVSAAAYTAVDLAEDEPDKAERINALAPGEIAAAANDIGAAIIHLSTDYVFDGDKTEPYRETDAVNPRSVYGRSKLKGERAVRAANPMHVILRT